jgi:hypothetical protein
MAWSALRASALASYLVLVAALVPSPARAEIYKWVDENRVVNYTEYPPSRGRAQVVSPESTPLTVYPAPRNEGTAGSLRESGLSERVDQLERQLARERQERESGAAEREARRLDRCRRERLIDCDEEIFDAGYPTAVIYQQPYWGKHHRPRPHPRPHRELEAEPRKPKGMLPPRR